MWIDLENIMLSETSQRQILYDITYMWSLKNYANECICKIETDSEIQKSNALSIALQSQFQTHPFFKKKKSTFSYSLPTFYDFDDLFYIFMFFPFTFPYVHHNFHKSVFFF